MPHFARFHLGLYFLPKYPFMGSSIQRVNPFHLGYLQTGTLANREEPDEMPHKAAFYQGLHFFAKIKTNLHDRNPL